MALRVVVYGEGGGEVSGTTILPRTPGKALSEPELGPAHHLVRRCIESHGNPVEEIVFEAWLIADHKSAGEVLGKVPSTPPDPESMEPGVAKNLLRTWIHELASDASEKKVRIDIARKRDLDVLYRTCRSFEQFVKQFD